MRRAGYVLRAALKSILRAANPCPNCGSLASVLIERKYLVTSLRRCSGCLMMFRAPTDDASDNERFYTEDYQQGFTTDLPSDRDLKSLLAMGFAGEKNYSSYIAVMRTLGIGRGSKVFDFGCSWGYGSYQLRQAGFDVTAFEVSKPRAQFAAESLGVTVVPDFDAWVCANGETQNLFFSAHVIEHVPSPANVFRAAEQVLCRGGLFLAFFPNGSASCRAAHPKWSQLWGQVHPNFIDEVFLNRAFQLWPRMFASAPVQVDCQLGVGSAAAIYLDDLSDAEMVFAARKP